MKRLVQESLVTPIWHNFLITLKKFPIRNHGLKFKHLLPFILMFWLPIWQRYQAKNLDGGQTNSYILTPLCSPSLLKVIRVCITCFPQSSQFILYFAVLSYAICHTSFEYATAKERLEVKFYFAHPFPLLSFLRTVIYFRLCPETIERESSSTLFMEMPFSEERSLCCFHYCHTCFYISEEKKIIASAITESLGFSDWNEVVLPTSIQLCINEESTEDDARNESP